MRRVADEHQDNITPLSRGLWATSTLEGSRNPAHDPLGRQLRRPSRERERGGRRRASPPRPQWRVRREPVLPQERPLDRLGRQRRREAPTTVRFSFHSRRGAALPRTSGLGQLQSYAVQQKRAYSITSSARSRKDSGMVRPSALAVLRLKTSSKLVGCVTGRSAGLAPLRTRPT
jgi:hypothetical protein